MYDRKLKCSYLVENEIVLFTGILGDLIGMKESSRRHLLAVLTLEMVRMIGLLEVPQNKLFYRSEALVTNILLLLLQQIVAVDTDGPVKDIC